MKLDINKIFGTTDEYYLESVLKKEDFDIWDNQIEVMNDIDFSLEMKEIEKEIFVKGKFNVKLKLECVKCLENFEQFLSEGFEVMYMPDYLYEEYEKSYKAEHEFNYKEVIREKLEDNCFIDIKKLIQEYIIVAMPDFPKCSMDCEGIKEVDNYQKNEIDPRWQQLLNIVKEK